MTDIVELLRDGNVCSREHNTCRNDWRMEEAAIEIERLRNENDQLRDTLTKIASLTRWNRAALGEDK